MDIQTPTKTETEAERWMRIANERMKTLRCAETTIDDMGYMVDQRDIEIKRLECVIDQRDNQIEAQRRHIQRLETAMKGKTS
jgi:uncharacterized protein (DUF3084 family)